MSLERRPLGKPELAPGEYVATCVSAERRTSAAGNKMIVWAWELPGGQIVSSYTVVRRVESGLTAQALGLELRPLRLADAAGLRCRVTVGRDGDWMRVTAVRPL